MVHIHSILLRRDSFYKNKKVMSNTLYISYYSETFKNHFLYQSAINNYSKKRYDSDFSLKSMWKTHSWAICIFSFTLAVILVNSYLVFTNFIK